MPAMLRMALSLLMMPLAGQAWADDPRLDPSRLQQQIERHAEQASKDLPAPSGDSAPWLREPPREATHGARGGYGRGYEQRYGASGANGGPQGETPGGQGFGRGGMAGGGGHGRR
ncbi:MAG: hypothetical protein FNT29_07230 [Halothiobacillaceae bacterium]|nr:MAG: hypothetical protein FNT29_07230 [Halothiobacillaceae bacterium]